MEKQYYALIKYLKDFRVYIMHSDVIAHASNNVVKNILTRPDPEGKKAKWIIVFLEYDLEIKPTNTLIKGQVLEKLMIDSNYDYLKIKFISDISSGPSSYLWVVKDFSLSP